MSLYICRNAQTYYHVIYWACALNHRRRTACRPCCLCEAFPSIRRLRMKQISRVLYEIVWAGYGTHIRREVTRQWHYSTFVLRMYFARLFYNYTPPQKLYIGFAPNQDQNNRLLMCCNQSQNRTANTTEVIVEIQSAFSA